MTAYSQTLNAFVPGTPHLAGESVAAEKMVDPENSIASRLPSPLAWKAGDWHGFLMVNAQLRYDDNIQPYSLKKMSDFIGTLSPAYNLEYSPPDARADLLTHLDYAPQFVNYLDHSEFNAINHLAHLKSGWEFGNSDIQFQHTFQITKEPTSEATSLTQIHDEATQLSFTYQTSLKTFVSLTPHQDWTHEESSTTLTVWDYGVNFELGYRLTEKLNVLVSYAPAQATANPGLDSFQQSVMGGISWNPSELCQLQVMSGFQTMTASGDGATAGNETPSFSLSWNYQFAPKTSLQIGGSYENSYSRYIAYQVNETLAGQLSISHALTEKIGLEFSAGMASLTQKAILYTATSGGQLFYWNTSSGVVYHYSFKTDFKLSYNFQERGASRLYLPYERNLVQLEINYRF